MSACGAGFSSNNFDSDPVVLSPSKFNAVMHDFSRVCIARLQNDFQEVWFASRAIVPDGGRDPASVRDLVRRAPGWNPSAGIVDFDQVEPDAQERNGLERLLNELAPISTGQLSLNLEA